MGGITQILVWMVTWSKNERIRIDVKKTKKISKSWRGKRMDEVPFSCAVNRGRAQVHFYSVPGLWQRGAGGFEVGKEVSSPMTKPLLQIGVWEGTTLLLWIRWPISFTFYTHFWWICTCTFLPSDRKSPSAAAVALVPSPFHSAADSIHSLSYSLLNSVMLITAKSQANKLNAVFVWSVYCF